MAKGRSSRGLGANGGSGPRVFTLGTAADPRPQGTGCEQRRGPSRGASLPHARSPRAGFRTLGQPLGAVGCQSNVPDRTLDGDANATFSPLHGELDCAGTAGSITGVQSAKSNNLTFEVDLVSRTSACLVDQDRGGPR